MSCSTREGLIVLQLESSEGWFVLLVDDIMSVITISIWLTQDYNRWWYQGRGFMPVECVEARHLVNEQQGPVQIDTQAGQGFQWQFINIGIKHGFSWLNIRQVPWEVLKTEAKGHGFQHLLRDLVNVNALKNHVWSLLLHKKLQTFATFHICFLHYFVLPFHRCLVKVISMSYARSRAGLYTSSNSSKSVAPVWSYWKLRSCAVTARELPC